MLGLRYLGFWLWLTSVTSDSLNNLVNLEEREIERLRLSMVTQLGDFGEFLATKIRE